MAKSVKKAVQQLTSGDPPARRTAAEELAGGDERALYPLVRALSDANAGVQDAAMRALISIGGEVTAYMVLPLLRENTLLRNTALIILKELGAVTVPLLAPLLKDKDADIRKFAIDLSGEITTGVEPSRLVPFLKDPNANVRAAAAKALGELGYREAIPALIDALGDEEWVCFSVLEALGELRAEAAIEPIARLLPASAAPAAEAASPAVRLAAIETLGKLGSERAVGILRASLPATVDEERSAVIKGLIQIGITPDMDDLAAHLLTMLAEGEWEDKEVALKGLVTLSSRGAVPVLVDMAGSLDPSLPPNEERLLELRRTLLALDAEEELLRLLDDPALKYRGKHVAIELLGEMRSVAAVPRLIGYLKDARRDLRRASSRALGAIAAPESLEHLLETSQRDVDAHVRRSAIEALGRIGAKEAFGPLVDLLEVEQYIDVIEELVAALLKIDSAAFLARLSRYDARVREIIAKTVQDVPPLLLLSEDADKKVKTAALCSLGRSGAGEALSRLLWFLGDADPDLRKAAVAGLGEAHYCSPELFGALRDEDPWVRFYAIKAVASSCAPEAAIERIGALVNDGSVAVVMSAVDAIAALGGRAAYEALAAHEDHANAEVREKIREALSTL